MTDEETIKRRLLIDGDGTGEDRRLNVLLKQFLKWANSKNDSPDTNQMMYDRLMAQLAQCQFAATKNERTIKMLDEELANFTKLSSTIEENIEMAKEEIEACKKELVIAKELRKNKMEYDLLAKLIEEQPDRKKTIEQIEIVKRDINQLTAKKLKLERKFEKRRNDFTLLMYTLRELEKQMEDETSNDSDKSDNESKSGTELSDDGVMEVSEEEDNDGGVIAASVVANGLGGSSKFNRGLKGDRDENGGIDYDEKATRLINCPSASTDDSKEPMSLDEDAVLELSIEKDEQDVDNVVLG